MEKRVMVKLFYRNTEEITEAILTVENGIDVLLVDGAVWTGRYDIIESGRL